MKPVSGLVINGPLRGQWIQSEFRYFQTAHFKTQPEGIAQGGVFEELVSYTTLMYRHVAWLELGHYVDSNGVVVLQDRWIGAWVTGTPELVVVE